MKRPGAVQWSIRILASLVALTTSVSAFAQSCPMCYNAAASSKASAIQALRSGTLILIFPVLFIFAGILVIAYRSRNRFNEVDAAAYAGLASSATRDAEGWAHRTNWEGLTAGGQATPLGSTDHELPLP
jgi:hypothetical protein